ncbi:hypothetical protein FA13DRAFT_1714972 [Coprinellus micaceus]|uniref:Uncharacterized protein n=1 Tax=Coprinellus micaceus TaxID=71717 RepID=A0A4Y7SQS6_COPMI|nr:hypothetical protein FA13DRAFT_1714972 [Coprinellus micaceus]
MRIFNPFIQRSRSQQCQCARRRFSQVTLGAVIAWAWKWDYAALVVLSHVYSIGEKAAQIIIRSRLCFLLAPFFPAEDVDAFFDLLFATGGAVVGDLAHRLTSSYNAVFDPTFDQCPTSYGLVVVVCNRLSMLYAVRWFEEKGYAVWRGVHVMGGQGMPGTNFLVGARCVEDLSTGRSVSIAYGDGVRTCGMPCIPSAYIGIITPAKIYRTLPSSGDISKDKRSGIQVVPWTNNYEKDSAGFLFYTIRDSLLHVTRPHNCWDQDCPQRSGRPQGSMNMWLDWSKKAETISRVAQMAVTCWIYDSSSGRLEWPIVRVYSKVFLGCTNATPLQTGPAPFPRSITLYPSHLGQAPAQRSARARGRLCQSNLIVHVTFGKSRALEFQGSDSEREDVRLFDVSGEVVTGRSREGMIMGGVPMTSVESLS